MMAGRDERAGAGGGPVVRLAIGVGGLSMCITLLALGMRAVMDVGGMCAEGGPYEIAQACPDGSVAAMLIGTFGLFLFGGLAISGGAAVGGAWGAVPLLTWAALFGVLGWAFLEYGIVNPPPGETVVWGWLIPGILFELIAVGPILLAAWAKRSGRGAARMREILVVRGLPGPRQRARAGTPAPAGRRFDGSADPAVSREMPERTAGSIGAIGSMGAIGASSAPASLDHDRPVRAADAASPALEPAVAGAGPGAIGGAFSEGTQALLDRLERLADLRDRGRLSPDEYEIAKDAVVRELETRG